MDIYHSRFSIIAWVLMLSWPVFAQRLNIKHYSRKDGLPQDQVLAIGQDAKGYLWAGSYVGLSRFDGRRWTSFTKREGLNRNTISALMKDDDRLLVGMQTGGLNAIQDGNVTSILPEEWNNFDVEDILKAANGEIWVAARGGVLRIDGENVRLFTQNDGLPHIHCQTLLEQKDGVILVGTEDGLAMIRGDVVEAAPPPLDSMNIRVILSDDEGGIYLGTSNGLRLISGKPALPEMTETLNIQCGAVGMDGTLWLGTTTKGVMFVKGSDVGFLNTTGGLPQNHILALFVDEVNNLWIGTDDGLSRLTASPFMAFTTTHGLVHNFVRALFIDKNKKLWIGARPGVSYMEGDYRLKTLDTSAFHNDRIYGITQHPDGRLLFAANDALVSYKDGEVRNYTAEEYPELNRLHAVYTDPWDRVWLGADGLMEFVDDKPVVFPIGHPLSEIKVIDMIRDKDGWLWLGAFKGLFSYHPDRAEVRTHKDFDLTVWDLDLDKNGNLLVGTNGMGVFIRTDTGFKNITTREGLGNDFVWQVLGADNGDLWVGHTNGLDRIRGDRIDHFDKNDGMAENEGSAATCIEDDKGGLWFGSAQGLTWFQPHLEPQARPLPRVHLEALYVNDDLEPLVPNAVFAPKRNTIALHFAGLLFGDEDHIRYTYMLEGLEEDWSKPTRDTEVKYRSLPHGDYVFHLKAGTSEKEWSPEQTWAFTVEPYFWETIWFRVLVLICIVAMVTGFFQWKSMTLKKKNILLSKLVDKRTQDLVKKNEDLEISQQRSRAMFEQADVSIVLFEQKTGAIEEFNDLAHMTLGYTREEFSKCSVHHVEGLKTKEAFQNYMKMILDSESQNVETRHHTKDGRVRDVVMRSRPIQIHGVDYVLGIWRDVTDRKAVQNQLLIAEKMASLGRLTAGIAHEMNTPIAAVRTSLIELEGLAEEYSASVGNAEVTDQDHLEIAAEMKQAIEIAKKAATRAAGFVQSTKSQTRNLEGRKCRVFKIDTVINESLLLLSHALRAGKSEISYECDQEGHEMYGAPGWLAQVITNLVTNAIDANEDMGGGKITVSLNKEGGQLRLVVKDEGSGIEPDKIQRIFDPMFTTKDIGKGTGLGLTIVHDIITGQLGGTISVESEPGRGAAFIMQFPINKEAPIGPNS